MGCCPGSGRKSRSSTTPWSVRSARSRQLGQTPPGLPSATSISRPAVWPGSSAFFTPKTPPLRSIAIGKIRHQFAVSDLEILVGILSRIHQHTSLGMPSWKPHPCPQLGLPLAMYTPDCAGKVGCRQEERRKRFHNLRLGITRRRSEVATGLEVNQPPACRHSPAGKGFAARKAGWKPLLAEDRRRVNFAESEHLSRAPRL